MRAVKDSLATPLGEGDVMLQKLQKRRQEGLVRRAHSRIDQAARWGEVRNLEKTMGPDRCHPPGFRLGIRELLSNRG